jgi:hypothetical protein
MTHDLGPRGRIIISACGGSGGAGGYGGNGQGGAHGQPGSDATEDVRGTDGHHGGDGGNAGRGSSGANGGKGGDIIIFLKEEDIDLFQRMSPPNVSGGKGGTAGKHGRPGDGGRGGKGGKPHFGYLIFSSERLMSLGLAVIIHWMVTGDTKRPIILAARMVSTATPEGSLSSYFSMENLVRGDLSRYMLNEKMEKSSDHSRPHGG